MVNGGDPLEFVLSSSVRADVLLAVGEGTGRTDDLLANLDASSSAIYNALGRLEEAGLLWSRDDEWTLTGGGRVIADFVSDRQRLGSLLAENDEYFASHDTRTLPGEFRSRITDLSGASVLRADDSEPQGVLRELCSRLEGTDTALVVAPIYDELLETAMPDTHGSRIVADRKVVEILASELDSEDEIRARLDHYGDDPIRISDVNFGLTHTDSALLLSLPLLDGQYDARTELIAKHDRARQWGRDLFEHVWDEAVPLEEHVLDTYL